MSPCWEGVLLTSQRANIFVENHFMVGVASNICDASLYILIQFNYLVNRYSIHQLAFLPKMQMPNSSVKLIMNITPVVSNGIIHHCVIMLHTLITSRETVFLGWSHSSRKLPRLLPRQMFKCVEAQVWMDRETAILLFLFRFVSASAKFLRHSIWLVALQTTSVSTGTKHTIIQPRWLGRLYFIIIKSSSLFFFFLPASSFFNARNVFSAVEPMWGEALGDALCWN